MNKDIIMSATSSSEFQLYTSSPDSREIFRSTTLHFPDAPPITTIKPQQQTPRKKRTKMTRLQNMKAIVGGSSCGDPSSKPKYVKKPDPSAPKITRPCTECGKTFWSWKALFGHMRCHPERPWRGINPPSSMVDHGGGSTLVTTNEDRYMASCLLMLANGTRDYNELGHPGWFECGSCKKVFGSHQALGGHRVSHKNIKGCYAITKKEAGEEGEMEGDIERSSNMNMMMVPLLGGSEHKCSICSRVFSSGQALGGHKRCHWEEEEEEEEEEEDVVAGGSTSVVSEWSLGGEYRVDLNMAAASVEDNSMLGLDLRLGL